MYVFVNERYSARRKKEILPFAITWMELDKFFIENQISKTEKNKYYMISLIWGIWTQTHRNRVEWLLQGVEGGRNREMVIKGYKIPVLRQISSGDLKYNMMMIVMLY